MQQTTNYSKPSNGKCAWWLEGKLTYNDDTGSPTIDLVETKIKLNNVIPDVQRESKFMSLHLKDMFLQTPIELQEFMKMSFKYFLPNIIQQYNLHTLRHNDFIYIRTKHEIYGLK